jgi:predicted nucleic acid-binding protein
MADLTMPNPPLIAVDTNVLIDLADGNEIVIDCFSTIRRKFPNAPIIIPPTVIGELADIATDGDSESEKESALIALLNIRSKWGFHPVNCVPVGHGIVEETARKIRAAGLIPDEEIHDSFIIAESALANVTLLLSSDGHLKDINQSALCEVLDGCDLGRLIIFSPAKIVKDFFDSVH